MNVPMPFVVRAMDQDLNPAPGVTVTFAVDFGGGELGLWQAGLQGHRWRGWARANDGAIRGRCGGQRERKPDQWRLRKGGVYRSVGSVDCRVETNIYTLARGAVLCGSHVCPY